MQRNEILRHIPLEVLIYQFNRSHGLLGTRHGVAARSCDRHGPAHKKAGRDGEQEQGHLIWIRKISGGTGWRRVVARPTKKILETKKLLCRSREFREILAGPSWAVRLHFLGSHVELPASCSWEGGERFNSNQTMKSYFWGSTQNVY